MLLSGQAAAQARESFETDWKQLVEAAKKEGRLALSVGSESDFQPALDAFAKEYGIQIQASAGSASSRMTRVLAERKAGRFTVDVALLSAAVGARRMQPADALEDVRSILIRPDVTDLSKWYGGRHWYVDEGGSTSVFVFAVQAKSNWLIWHNTQKLSRADVATIRTPQDLLNPKWKGMMADQSWHDPGRVGDMLEVYFAPDAGPEWVRRYLTEMDVVFTNEPRLEETWLVRGRNPLKWNEGNIGTTLRELSPKNLPIEQVRIPKAEGTLEARGSCCLVIFKNAPNPNAARLFVNWFLTADAQRLAHSTLARNVYTSLREDVPQLDTVEASRRIPGQKYSFRDFDTAYLAKVEEARQFIVKTFTTRNQKQ